MDNPGVGGVETKFNDFHFCLCPGHSTSSHKPYLRQFCHQQVEAPIIGHIREHDGPEWYGGPDRLPGNGQGDRVGGGQSCCDVVSLCRGDAGT